MDCSIILDLIPLYIDNCCSEQSAAIVKEHIGTCQECKAIFDSMNAPPTSETPIPPPAKFERINDWKASVLQSVLLFSSFAAITLGVSLEAASPSGLFNGFWAFNLVISPTGFLLSLANWYFVRLYKTRRSFSNYCALATLAATVCAYIIAGFHYELNIIDLAYPFTYPFVCFSIQDCLGALMTLMIILGGGILLTAALCLLSKMLSNKYAKMLGKE